MLGSDASFLGLVGVVYGIYALVRGGRKPGRRGPSADPGQILGYELR